MGRNKILHDKSKIWISVIVGIVLLVTVCRIMFRLMGDVPAMEDIYFQAYNDQMQETVIYRYDADNGEVSEVGKVAGYFHNCNIGVVCHGSGVFLRIWGLSSRINKWKIEATKYLLFIPFWKDENSPIMYIRI